VWRRSMLTDSIQQSEEMPNPNILWE
jgi:hypothetical protein